MIWSVLLRPSYFWPGKGGQRFWTPCIMKSSRLLDNLLLNYYIADHYVIDQKIYSSSFGTRKYPVGSCLTRYKLFVNKFRWFILAIIPVGSPPIEITVRRVKIKTRTWFLSYNIQFCNIVFYIVNNDKIKNKIFIV